MKYISIQATLKALSDPTRRQILNLLKEKNLSAGEISNQFNISAASISHHLNILKNAGLLLDEKKGKFIIYELNVSVLDDIMLWVKDLKGENNENK